MKRSQRILTRTYNGIVVRSSRFYQMRFGRQSFVVLLACAIGIAAAGMAALLHFLVAFLETVPGLLQKYPAVSLALFLLPLAGIALSYGVQRYFGGVFYAKSLSPLILQLHRNKTRIPLSETVTHILSSGLSVGLGGAAGLEAPSVLCGTAVGANIASFFRVDRPMRSLLLGCGAAAAISAIFGSPIAGVLFAAEVLLAEFSVSALIPMMISSALSAVFTRLFVGESLVFFKLPNVWQSEAVPYYVLLGICCAFAGIYMIRCSYALGAQIRKLLSDRWQRLCCGGLVLCALLALLPPLKGQGYAYIRMLFSDEGFSMLNELPFASFLPPSMGSVLGLCFVLMLLKVVALAFTIESGGDGGIFAPSMFAGACLGYTFVKLVNLSGIAALDEANFIAAGMCGVFTAVLRAPMTGIFLIADVTDGHAILVPLMIVSSLAFFIARRMEPHSVYLKVLAENNLLDEDRDKTLLHQLLVKSNMDRSYHALKATDLFGTVLGLISRTGEDVFPVLEDDGTLSGLVRLEKIREVMLNNDLYNCLVVYDFMEDPPAVLSTEDDLAAAMAAFDRFHRSWTRLPVCDGIGRFRGFVDKNMLFNKYRALVKNSERF